MLYGETHQALMASIRRLVDSEKLQTLGSVDLARRSILRRNGIHGRALQYTAGPAPRPRGTIAFVTGAISPTPRKVKKLLHLRWG